MNTLDSIALKHGTDKSSAHHNYCPAYERFLAPMRNRPISLCEFGVDQGASIKMWLEYFPNANVVGCDYIDCQPIDDPRYTFHKGQITDINFWNSLGMFDVIIDDNGHYAKETLKAMEFCGDHIKPGGLFIIEDLHTCFNDEFSPKTEINPMDAIFRTVHTMNDYGRSYCGDNRNDACKISFVHLVKSLAIIGYK
jgi:hypothetical protein